MTRKSVTLGLGSSKDLNCDAIIRDLYQTRFRLRIYVIHINSMDYDDPDAGKDCRQEEKGTTEDEMIGWNHCLNGQEFE